MTILTNRAVEGRLIGTQASVVGCYGRLMDGLG
jgi:hypothetical protein